MQNFLVSLKKYILVNLTKIFHQSDTIYYTFIWKRNITIYILKN